MSIVDKHIGKHLLHFQNEGDSLFDDIFEIIQSEVKQDHYLLLHYIHLLLNEVFSEEISDTKTLHLHFEYDLNHDSLLVIAQYLLIRFFKENKNTNKINNDDITKLQELKIRLRSIEKRISEKCPEGAKGGSKIYKDWIREKKDVKTLISFYNQLNDNINISTNALFNCQVQLAKSLNTIFETRPYAKEIESKNNLLTFNLLNTKLTLNQIDERDNSIIDNLETTILFDCERKKLMQYFSLKDISDYDIKLKKYLIITFGTKSTSTQNLRDRINLIQNRFKVASENSYPIIRSEIDYTLGNKSNKYIPVSFLGLEVSHFWNTFVLETNIQDLYELRSVKMMNLYSLCFSQEIKNHILQEIFSEAETSYLISDETKQKLLYLRSDDLSALKESLENMLNLIISSDIKQIISNKIKSETIFIVDNFILNSKKLRSLISSSLLLTDKNKLVSWSAFENLKNEAIIILSYQDQGKYPYYFYPNVIETTVAKSTAVEAIFHKFLFYNRYQWAKHNISKEIYRLTDHPIRKRYFHWERLKDSINNLRPQKEDEIDWNLEQQYAGSSERETIKLKLKGAREKTFNSSDLFIYSIDNISFRVEKIGDIINLSDDVTEYSVHNLDEIQENINIYERIIDKNQHEEELNIIRKEFDIEKDTTGRLWKILLKKKAHSFGENIVYDNLKKHFEKKDLKIVSLNHFQNNWLNPESDSIAPLSKKVFIELCDFLELPKLYFVLIQRLRNTLKQSSRQSTQQMNRLLQNLFNDGCFDDGINLSELIAANIEKYKSKHPLDELGIDEKYLGKNLIALVQLIKPEIRLKEIENSKRPNNE